MTPQKIRHHQSCSKHPPVKGGKFGKHRHRGIFDQCKPPYSGYHLPTNGLEQTLIILIQRLVNVLYLGDSIHITFLRYLLEMMLPIVGWWLGHLPSPWFFGDDCQSCPQQSPSPSPVTVGHDTIPCPGAYLRKKPLGFPSHADRLPHRRGFRCSSTPGPCSRWRNSGRCLERKIRRAMHKYI